MKFKNFLSQISLITTLFMILTSYQNCSQKTELASSIKNDSMYGLRLLAPTTPNDINRPTLSLNLSSSVPLTGKTYYVSTTGSDNRSCANAQNISTPLRTFVKSISCLQPGDTLLIRAGIYTERIDLMTPNKTGTATGWLKIAGYPGEIVTIRHSSTVEASYGNIKARGNRGYILFENLVLDGSNQGNKTQGFSFRDGNHHMILKNVEIKNHEGTAVGINGNYIQIVDCKLHDNVTLLDLAGNRHYGIYLRAGNNILIDGNSIYRNDGGGITVYYGPTSNVVIRNNRIYENNKLSSSQVPGIQVMPGDGNTIKDIQIYNNLVYLNGLIQPDNSSSGGIQIVAASNIKIWHNTIYGNHGFGIQINNSVNSMVQNNISYGNRFNNYSATSNVNLIADHNIFVNPLFKSIVARDFRLTAGSPARNTGKIISSVPKDIIGVLRGSVYDVGAYEY